MQHYFYVNDLSVKVTQTRYVNIALLDFPIENQEGIDLSLLIYKYDLNMSRIFIEVSSLYKSAKYQMIIK